MLICQCRTHWWATGWRSKYPDSELDDVLAVENDYGQFRGCDNVEWNDAAEKVRVESFNLNSCRILFPSKCGSLKFSSVASFLVCGGGGGGQDPQMMYRQNIHAYVGYNYWRASASEILSQIHLHTLCDQCSSL